MIKTKIPFSATNPYSKPTCGQIIPGTQLFSRDINKNNGAKMFLLKSYQDMYNIVKNDKNKCYYEDHTFNEKIKLHIDIDVNRMYLDAIDRNKDIDVVIDNLMPILSQKIYDVFNISNPRTIILISDTLLKLSIHIVYIDILFSDIYSMGHFLSDFFSFIDPAVYKHGCFRMVHCNKIGKNNTLVFYKGYYYNYSDDYQLFIDSCLCSDIVSPTVDFEFDKIIKCGRIKNAPKQPMVHSISNYKYTKPDFAVIKKALEKIDLNNYNDWFKVSCSIKNLYLGLNIDDANELYEMYDSVCSTYSNYDYDNNLNTFNNIDPLISINYLFYLAAIKYSIQPIYDYKKFMFNPDNHKNIIIDNTQNINCDISELVKHKLICFKSPTGTGKTRYLKNIIDHLKIPNIISIVSRVNLAGEHKKTVNLKFYKELSHSEFHYCDRLVVQLESLHKCNYKLFNNGVLIMDEINSLLSHMRSPTMNNRRAVCYKYLMTLIVNAKHIIAMDVDLCDWNISFISEIQPMDYVVYYNTIKNKINTPTTFYLTDQIVIEKMIDNIKINKFFVACFDSLKSMKRIINFIKSQIKTFEPLVYSSEIDYDLIDTTTWDNRFVFYTPTIIYGISYENFNRDVYCFVHKNHLNPLQIYQMINRVRKLDNVHIYCNDRVSKITYDDIHMIKDEEDVKIATFKTLFSNIESQINEQPYNIMHHNFKFMDTILKTNIKYYIIDMMVDKGFSVKYNNIIKAKIIKDNAPVVLDKTQIIDRLVDLLKLDRDNLDDFHQKLVTNDGNAFEKHINLRCWLAPQSNLDKKIFSDIENNLFSETLNSRFLKIKYCREIGKILNINSWDNLTKNITKYFNTNIENVWLAANLNSVIKIFRLSGDKYKTTQYYKLYQMYISMLKQLFDDNIIMLKRIKINKKGYFYYIINYVTYNKHIELINKCSITKLLKSDFIN
jgi:hypothetical protein